MLKINFDEAFYPSNAVKKAIKDYQGLADFSVQKKKNRTIVSISNIRNKELTPLIDKEFSNYVLSLTAAEK
ncbi:MAG: HxsD-like protein [Candidatus Omnitrophota bacterium]